MPPAHVPIYVASLGPANLRLTGELADGWIGNSFFPETADVFFDPIREGAAAAGRDIADLDLTVSVGLEITDDVEAAGRRHAEGYAFTFGAMGSATTNFYNDAFERQGYGDDVREVQRLWLVGRQGGRPQAGAHRDRPRHEPRRHRRHHPRTSAPLSRRRRHHAASRPAGRLASTRGSPTSATSSTLRDEAGG